MKKKKKNIWMDKFPCHFKIKSATRLQHVSASQLDDQNHLQPLDPIDHFKADSSFQANFQKITRSVSRGMR